MISIITPFYQAEKYLEDAINSVVKQTYKNWELLLINDGSSDLSKDIALSFADERIRYFEQENKGVSAARNVGLSKMKGDYFCFLDADDYLTQNSLRSRRLMFDFDSTTKFVDGVVIKMDSKLETKQKSWNPDFYGNPLSDLVKLTGNCFFGPTWMIKRDHEKIYKLEEKLTHTEDLYFYMKLAKEGGKYLSTSDCILHYRDTPNSAMKNLRGLEEGYRFIENQIKNWKEVNKNDYNIFKLKYRKAMFLAYLRTLKLINALKVIL
jgi:glycosyltransferase involved in cell wall biosynthesis